VSFEAEAMIIKEIEARFHGAVIEAKVQRKRRIAIEAGKEWMRDIAKYLKERFDFAIVVSVSAIDLVQERQFAIVYHLWSPSHRNLTALRTKVPKDSARAISLTPLFESANWHEREAHELYGIEFDGHPDLGRLLLPEDWNGGFPFRKDFKLAE